MSFSKTRLRVTEHHVEWLKLSGLSERMKLFSFIQLLVIVWGSADPWLKTARKSSQGVAGSKNDNKHQKTRQKMTFFLRFIASTRKEMKICLSSIAYLFKKVQKCYQFKRIYTIPRPNKKSWNKSKSKAFKIFAPLLQGMCIKFDWYDEWWNLTGFHICRQE